MRREPFAANESRKPALSTRLLQHVSLPLMLIWLLGAAIAVGVGDMSTQQAFDRALLDDAYVVGAHVARRPDRVALTLTATELDAVLFDQSETIYFAVISDDGKLLAGQPGLEFAAAPGGNASYAFSNIERGRQRLRAVVLKQAPDYSVVIAQTTQTRTSLLQRLLLYSIAPQLVLLALVGWGLREIVRRDLAPLTALQQSLDARDAADLTPLPPALARDAGSREVERVGVAIDALLGRVSDGVRAQREFAGNVAHELRTPLAGLRALAEYGLGQSDPHVVREQMQAILESQARASHLVDQLLALALADESRAGLTLVPVALDEVARDVILRLLSRADQVGVDLGAEGLEPGMVVMGNVALVEGVLVNLVDNALRHGRAGRAEGSTVTVELCRVGSEVRLSVIDNGPGMSAWERAVLLQRWAQGPRREGSGGGVGLGLAIVARYAQLLRARFELSAAPGGGGLAATLAFAAVSA